MALDVLDFVVITDNFNAPITPTQPFNKFYLTTRNELNRLLNEIKDIIKYIVLITGTFLLHHPRDASSSSHLLSLPFTSMPE